MLDNIKIEQILEWPEMADVKAELEDPRFGGRRHSRATAALGCNGPLCRKAERDRSRNRNQQRAKEAGRAYRPSDSRLYDRDDLLQAIYTWHVLELAKRKLRSQGLEVV